MLHKHTAFSIETQKEKFFINETMISEVAERGALKSLSRINPEQRRGIWSIPRGSAAKNEIHIDTSQFAAGSFIPGCTNIRFRRFLL
ncbi:MAG: hypothetical protein NT126_11590 [Bacteroidetes bacterium]|nr:hypothetical protein [Bacteroidota bacterium]